MTVEIFSSDKRLLYAKNVITSGNLDFERVYLMPIPSTKDGIFINGTDIKLSDIYVGTKDAVIAYGLPDGVRSAFISRGAVVYDGSLDEDFLVFNAKLTALGVLGNVITKKKKSPEDVRFGVIGYGRIGRELVKYLYFVGATPTVYTSKEEVQKQLSEAGVNASLLSDADFENVDVIINTAPVKILDRVNVDRPTASEVAIFDLASGDNFESSSGVIKLMSVPGKVYPESAGVGYGEMALKYFTK